MGRLTLSAAFAGTRRVLLDTGPTIDALEKNPEWGGRARAALEHLFDEGVEVIATPITLSECVAGAPQADVPAYTAFLTGSQEITFVPLDATIALVAGERRKATGLKLPDCLQVATGVVKGCDLILTNDLELGRRQSALPARMLADLDP